MAHNGQVQRQWTPFDLGRIGVVEPRHPRATLRLRRIVVMTKGREDAMAAKNGRQFFL
jgi:hypothetical protein